MFDRITDKIILVMGLILLCIAVGLPIHQNATEDAYSGKVVLVTAQEHQDFLEAIGQPEVRVTDNNLDFAAESPVTAKFSVSVPAGYDFPYGKENRLPSEVLSLALVFGGLAAFCLGGYVWLRRMDTGEWTKEKK